MKDPNGMNKASKEQIRTMYTENICSSEVYTFISVKMKVHATPRVPSYTKIKRVPQISLTDEIKTTLFQDLGVVYQLFRISLYRKILLLMKLK